jgi:hypothetical protein
VAYSNRKKFRTILTGLSVHLRNIIVIICSRGALQPSGIRRFGDGVSQLSPLRPVLGNGDPLIENLRNALTFERVLQRPAPSHLWTTNRSTNAILNQSVTAVVPGSWAYVRRGQPNEESDYESNCRCQETRVPRHQATEGTRGSDTR